MLELFVRGFSLEDNYYTLATPEEKQELENLADAYAAACKAMDDFPKGNSSKYGQILDNGEDQAAYDRLWKAAKDAQNKMNSRYWEIAPLHTDETFEHRCGISRVAILEALESSGLATKLDAKGLACADYEKLYIVAVHNVINFVKTYDDLDVPGVRSFLQVEELGKSLTAKGIAKEYYEEEFVDAIYSLLGEEREDKVERCADKEQNSQQTQPDEPYDLPF